MLYKIDFLILQIKKMSSEMESNLYKSTQEDVDRWVCAPYLEQGKERIFSAGSVVKNLPAMPEMRVQSLDQENLLEKKGMASQPGILAWKIPWTEEPGGLQSTGLQRVGHDWASKHKWVPAACHAGAGEEGGGVDKWTTAWLRALCGERAPTVSENSVTAPSLIEA